MPEKSAFDFDAGFDKDFDIEVTVAGDKAKIKEAPVSSPAPVVGERQEAHPQGTAGGKEAQRHTATSLYFAKELTDLTDEEIAELTPKELDTAVRVAHRAMLRQSSEFTRNQIKQGDGPKPAPPAEAVKPEVPAEEEDEFAEFRDALAPQVIEAIKKARGKDKQLIETLQKRLDEGDQKEQARAREQVFDAIDAEFAKMPAAVKALIGEGGRSDIEKDSLQHTLRVHIIQQAEKDKTPNLSFAQKMQKAASALSVVAPGQAKAELSEEYGEEVEAAPAPAAKPAPVKDEATGRFAARPQAEREAAWKEAGTAKPTQRTSPEPKGERKAMQTARKIMMERGMLDEADMPADAFPK